MKKYELTNDSITIDGHTLYRIQALRDFPNILTGAFGGFVESEDNLSHDGSCWAYDDSKIFDKARVFGNTRVCGTSMVYDNAKVYGTSHVYDSLIFRNAYIRGRYIFEGSKIFGNTWISIEIARPISAMGLNIPSIPMFKDIILDRGFWIDLVNENGKNYLISSTLEKRKI